MLLGSTHIMNPFLAINSVLIYLMWVCANKAAYSTSTDEYEI